MRNTHRLAVVAIILMTAHSLTGCTLLDKNADLPKEQKVKVLVFPVRSLQFENLICMQDAEHLTLDGSVRNAAYWTISNIQLRAKIIYYDQALSQGMTSAQPIGPLMPGEASQFSLAATVDYPVKQVELHATWDSSP